MSSSSKAKAKRGGAKKEAADVELEAKTEHAMPTAEPVAAPQANGVLYIDATGHVAGRLCSLVAAQILTGKRIIVLNAEMAVLSGKRDTIIEAWKQKLELGSKVNPIYGPLHHRRPDNILWRMVRGMVPKEKPKGVLALKRLRVYIGVPQKYSGVSLAKLDDAMATRPLPMYPTIAELSKNIGWNG